MNQSTARHPDQEPLQELRILDDRGCVTTEAMCFLDQLSEDHRAVVDRHVRSCIVCAQQHADLVGVTDRLQAVRPRIQLPSEVKLLSREVVRRVIAARQSQANTGSPRRRRPTARVRVVRPTWYRSTTLWTAVLTGLAVAMLVALIGLIIG
jgi:hypothetical protein